MYAPEENPVLVVLHNFISNSPLLLRQRNQSLKLPTQIQQMWKPIVDDVNDHCWEEHEDVI